LIFKEGKDDIGILVNATCISIESEPAESKRSERKVRKYELNMTSLDRAAFVFGRERVSFTYFVFVSAHFKNS